MMAQQKQQAEQNARYESQIQVTNTLVAQMMEMNLTIRNESVQQNNAINTQLASLVTKAKSHPKNALELFAAASATIRDAVSNPMQDSALSFAS
jgi:hypothetical protein